MIQELLNDKYVDGVPMMGIRGEWMDRKEWTEYPGNMVINDVLTKVRFTDANLEYDSNNYSLEIVGLFEDNTGFEFIKKCYAPEGCRIMWDRLLCAYDLTTKK